MAIVTVWKTREGASPGVGNAPAGAAARAVAREGAAGDSGGGWLAAHDHRRALAAGAAGIGGA